MDDENAIAGCALLIIVLIAAGVFAFLKLNTVTAMARVDKLYWQRYINVERFKPVYQDTSESSMPSDAYSIERYTTRSCVPIKIGKITSMSCTTHHKARYWVNRWVYDYTLELRGTPKDERQYPEFTPSPSEELGAVRESTRGENLYIDFKVNDKVYTYTASDYQDWSKYQLESGYRLEINRLDEPQWLSLAKR